MDKDKSHANEGHANKGRANKGKGRARKGTPIRYDSIITARPDTKITLRVEFSSESHDPIPWDGLVIPRTYSVKRSERRTLQQPVKFRLWVYGASSPAEEPWNVCNKCRTNEYQRRYKSPPTPEQFAQFQVPLVDFDAPDPSIILQDGSADVDFRFRCYPNHKSHHEEKFKYVLSTYLSVCLLLPGLSLSYTEITSRLCSTRFVVPLNFFLMRSGRWNDCIQTAQVLKVEVCHACHCVLMTVPQLIAQRSFCRDCGPCRIFSRYRQHSFRFSPHTPFSCGIA